jgi:hypothetical protein
MLFHVFSFALLVSARGFTGRKKATKKPRTPFARPPTPKNLRGFYFSVQRTAGSRSPSWRHNSLFSIGKPSRINKILSLFEPAVKQKSKKPLFIDILVFLC